MPHSLEQKRAWAAARRANRKAAEVCLHCGKQPAHGGLQSCETCRSKRLASQKRSYAKMSPDQLKRANLRRYKISLEQFGALKADQECVCAICSCPSAHLELHVDHNHQTKEVRGLLCSECNQGLGKFQDSPDLLLAAAKYLSERGCAPYFKEVA